MTCPCAVYPPSPQPQCWLPRSGGFQGTHGTLPFKYAFLEKGVAAPGNPNAQKWPKWQEMGKRGQQRSAITKWLKVAKSGQMTNASLPNGIKKPASSCIIEGLWQGRAPLLNNDTGTAMSLFSAHHKKPKIDRPKVQFLVSLW